jgi:hypothetical protein
MTKKELKLYHKNRMRRRLDRAKDGGFVQSLTFIEERDDKAIQARARTMNVPKLVIASAIMAVGMRHLTTSDIIRANTRWKGIFEKPAVPRYPGSDFNPKLRHNHDSPKKKEREALSA